VHHVVWPGLASPSLSPSLAGAIGGCPRSFHDEPSTPGTRPSTRAVDQRQILPLVEGGDNHQNACWRGDWGRRPGRCPMLPPLVDPRISREGRARPSSGRGWSLHCFLQARFLVGPGLTDLGPSVRPRSTCGRRQIPVFVSGPIPATDRTREPPHCARIAARINRSSGTRPAPIAGSDPSEWRESAGGFETQLEGPG